MSTERATQLLEAGVWLRMTGDNDGARALFEKALAIDPNNARARQLLQETKGAAKPAGAAAAVTSQPVPPPPAVAALAPPLPPAPPPPVAPVASHQAGSTVVYGGRAAPLPPAPAVASPNQTLVFAGAPVPQPVASSAPVPAHGPGQTMLFPSLSGPPPSPPPAPAPTISSAWDEQVPERAAVIEVSSSTAPDAFAMLASQPLPPPEASPPTRKQKSHDEEELEALLAGVKDLIELDDHTGAMDLLVKAQELAPNDPKVKEIRARSEQILITRYESKLGDLLRLPRVRLKQDEIIWLNLDHRAGFVLAQIDGTVSYEDLFAVCGMSRLDTARILAQLVDERVIA
jgi:hypothetical protein